MTVATTHPDWLALGTSTLSEASGLHCSLDPALRPLWPGAAVAGPAYPVQCGREDNLAIHRGVDLAPAGSVLVVAAEGAAVGHWGEILTWAALERGIAGLVIDGSVRDVDALERLGFPVFARGVSMRGTGKQVAGVAGEPVEVTGVLVTLGDQVVGDRDGVLVLPGTVADQVLAAGRARVEKEQAVIARLRAGERTLDVYGWREVADGRVPVSAATDGGVR
jgi:4-hydroxy-4-methyl-2-oxoglutarate aldolase